MTPDQTQQPEKATPTPRNRRQWTVIGYDIPDDKRRTKVMQTLEGHGHRVQYSVFECDLRPADLNKLQQRLTKLINEEEDDVRIYTLCEHCVGKVTALGKAQTHRQPSSVIVG